MITNGSLRKDRDPFSGRSIVSVQRITVCTQDKGSLHSDGLSCRYNATSTESPGKFNPSKSIRNFAQERATLPTNIESLPLDNSILPSK